MNRKFQRSSRRFSMSARVRVPRRCRTSRCCAAWSAEGLVELLQQIADAEVRRGLERVVVADDRQRHSGDRQPPAASGIGDHRHVLGELFGVEERGDRHRFLGFLVDHHGHADAAVGVAAAGQVAPRRLGAVDLIGPVGERAHERDWEPVADGFAHAGLVLHVVGQVRQGVALRGAALRRDQLVAAGEADRLERQEVDLLGVVEGELDHPADLLVVDAVDDGDHRHDVDAGVVQVLDRLELDVEQVADPTMRVGGVADAVELQVGIAQPGLGGLLGELRALGELDAVGGRLHRGVADLAGVTDGIEEVRRQRRLAARELHRHLPPGLDADGVVEHLLDVVPGQLVDEADLVGVHEARVAHHVAAVGQVDGEHRATAVLDGAAAVVVQLLVVVGAHVAAREDVLEVLEEVGVDGHHVFEMAVDGQSLTIRI